MPQYLGRLAVNATTIINARDYGRTIHDLVHPPPADRDRRGRGQHGLRLAGRLPAQGADRGGRDAALSLAETDKYGQGFLGFSTALTHAIEMANNAYKRDGHLSGTRPPGFTDLDGKMGGLQPSDLIVLAGRPSMGKTALATNIAYNVAKQRTSR